MAVRHRIGEPQQKTGEKSKMKFIHIADVHLGAQPDSGPLYSGGRSRELWETFERVIRVCEDEQADLLLIAGDLFHRQPLVRELREVDYFFSELTHTKVVLIAGNHDYIGANSNYRTFRWRENVFPLFGEKPQYVDFPELKTAVYGLSYHSREISRPLYDGFTAAGAEPFEILLAHGGDEKHIPFDRRTRRNVAKALQNGVVIGPSDDYPAFWRIITANLDNRYSAKPVHSLSEIELLHSRFPENIRLYSASLDGRMVAGAVMYEEGDWVHAQYSSADETGFAIGAMNYLFYHLITEEYKGKSCFDFGTSNEKDGQYLNANLIETKTGLGARGVAYNIYEMII